MVQYIIKYWRCETIKKILCPIVLCVILCGNITICFAETLIHGVGTLNNCAQAEEKTDEFPKTIEEIYDMDITEPCGLTKEQLENAMPDNMKCLSTAYISAEEYGVNAVYILAVSALESGWCTSNFSKNKNNLFGWKGENGYTSFSTKEECVLSVSKWISMYYLTEPADCDCQLDECDVGCYYNGKTVGSVTVRYCPVDGVNINKDYESVICEIMFTIYNNALNIKKECA